MTPTNEPRRGPGITPPRPGRRGPSHVGPAAVVVGGRLPALSAVRALGRRGVPIVVVATRADHVAQYSRFVSERHSLLEFSERPGALLELLEARRESWRGSVLFATDDQSLETLSRHRAELEGDFRVAAPPFETTRQLLRKDLLHRVAAEVGVAMPKLYGPASSELLARGDLRFPLVVKPAESYRFEKRFGRKLFLAPDRRSLAAGIDAVEAAGIDAEVLEFVPGPDTCFYNHSVYLDAGGEVVAELGLHKLRKSPPFFGVCRVAEVAETPELREPTLRILRRVGWHGMANAEFKRDPRDGRFRLMEINGRCFLMQGLALAAGTDYPSIAWDDLVRGEAEPRPSRAWDGVWINEFEDVYHWAMFRKVEGIPLREYLAPWRRRKAFAIWSRDDPKPFLMHCALGARKVGRMLLDRRYRREVTGRVQPLAEVPAPRDCERGTS